MLESIHGNAVPISPTSYGHPDLRAHHSLLGKPGCGRVYSHPQAGFAQGGISLFLTFGSLPGTQILNEP